MNSKVFSNFIWRVFERWGAQGVTLIVGIILARLLDPKVYGTIALVTVFTTVLQVFVDSGLGTALVQKKDADDIDFSSVFWFNVLICIFLYVCMFFLSPILASFFNNSELTSIIRVLSIIIIISGVKNIQQAYVSRNMMFKKFFFSTLGGTIGAAFVGILLAYKGLGVWALVYQYIINGFIDTIILWCTVKWRPRFVFSLYRFSKLFSYGWKILLSSLIDTIYNELRSLIIGKYYSDEDLAFYTKGMQFPKYAVDSINSSMYSVLFTVLANEQEDIYKIKISAKRVIQVSSFLIFPMMLGLCAVGKNFVIVLLTEKWLPAAKFLQILCICYALEPLQSTNLSIIKALGRADLHLKMEIIKKSIAIIIVCITSFFGVTEIAIGSVIYAIIAFIINSFPNKKLINYGFAEQLKDVFPYFFISLIMGIIVIIVGLVPLNIYILFVFQVLVGVIIYLALVSKFSPEVLVYCKKLVKSNINRKKFLGYKSEG